MPIINAPLAPSPTTQDYTAPFQPLPPSTLDYFEAKFGQGAADAWDSFKDFSYTVGSKFLPDDNPFDPKGRPITDNDYTPDDIKRYFPSLQVLDPAEANQKYPVEVPWTAPVPENAARMIWEKQQADAKRADIINRYGAGPVTGTAGFLSQAAPSIVDPWNVLAFTGIGGPASGLLKIAPFAEGQIARLLPGTVARLGGKFVGGAAEGAIGGAALTPIEADRASAEHRTYTLDNAMNSVAQLALGVGVLHLAHAAPGEIWRKLAPDTQKGMMDSVAGQSAREVPISAPDQIKHLDPRVNALDAAYGRELSDPELAVLTKARSIFDKEPILTPEEIKERDSLTRLEQAQGKPGLDPLTVEERQELSDLSTFKESKLPDDQERLFQELKANPNRSSEDNQSYRFLRDIRRNGLARQPDLAERLDYLSRLDQGQMSPEESARLNEIRAKEAAGAALTPAEQDIYDRLASEPKNPVDPNQMLNGKYNTIKTEANYPDNNFPNDFDAPVKPNPTLEPDEEINQAKQRLDEAQQQTAPDKPLESEEIMKESQTRFSVVQSLIDCLTPHFFV